METQPRWLSEEEQTAWRAYRRMLTVVPALIERDTMRDSGLSGPDYEVLSTVGESPPGTWQLRHLAAKMLWSRSRLSHHLTRMERRGLVTRSADPADARGCIIDVTPQGRSTLAEAAPAHVESVRRHLIDHLSPEEFRALGALCAKVADST
jgi:DNA-binding MarR family transcriptional regulator